ncbi:MAG: hypothetical protein AAGF45_11845 [Pseudomonadota bacterium]
MRTLMIAVIMVIPGAPALAQSDINFCDNPTLTLSDRMAEHIDHGAEGLSVGDRRVGRMTLRTSDGAEAGVMFFQSQMLREPAAAQAHFVTGQNTFVTDRGTIFTLYAQESPDQDYGDADHRPHALELAVIGGTGLYADARGTITVAPRAERPSVTVSLTCP